MYVREQIAISKHHTWFDEQGLNQDAPVRSLMFGFDGSIGGRIGGKINGKIQGKRNVESGHLARICSMGGKVGGKIAGRIAVESGQIQMLARKTVESGQLAHNCKTANHIRWHIKRNVINSQCKFCNPNTLDTICTVEGCNRPSRTQQLCLVHYQRLRKHGDVNHRRNTRINVESGQIRTLNHLRYHVRRNIINPKCIYCSQVE